MRPLFEVRGRIESDLMVRWPGNHHHPMLRWLVPENFRIAEIVFADVEHRVARKLRPGAALVVAVGDMLVLAWLRGVMARVNGNQWRLAVLAEAAAVLPIDHGAAGE